MTITNPEQSIAQSMNLDPTMPAPMTNVAEYGFEGRFEDWADDARYFEYSKAANPIGSGHVPQVPIVRFGPELYLDEPTGVVPLDLSEELGIDDGEATSPALLANFLRIRAGEQIDTSPNATSQLYYVLLRAGLCGGQRPAGRVGEGRLFDPARRIALGVLRRRRRGHVLGARRAAAALPGCRRHPSRGSARPSSAGRTRWPSSPRSPRAPAPTTRAGSACCWPTPTKNRR